MRIRSARLAISAAVLATAALTLTACSPDGSGNSAAATASPSQAGSQTSASSTGGTAPVSTTGSTTPTATSGSTGSTGSGSTGSTTRTEAGSGAAAAGHACASSQLSVSRSGESVGAGQLYAKIVFTNKASTSCTLTGYPGLSYVAAAGAQSGNPATRDGGTVHTVTLAAHGSASATMHDSNGLGGYTSGQCHLASVQGLRIYPPNQKGALFLPWKTDHCAGTAIHPLSVGPVQS